MKTLQFTVLVRAHTDTPTQLLCDKEMYPFFPRDMVVYRIISHLSLMVVETLREE